MSAQTNCHFFEGTEKLLEVWLCSSTENSRRSLRSIERCKWENLLTCVNCEIVSHINNDHMDAYLLSESSMFVSDERVILKTCGQTTLLAAVKPLLTLAKDECGLDIIMDIFFSRKNYARPELQRSTHRNFDKEIEVLDDCCSNGAAYALGRINKDCWYLYTLDDDRGVNQPDQTLELLMQDLDQNRMDVYRKEHSHSGAQATQLSGIDQILPGTTIDDFLFEPCGYSMNGLLPDGHYITIHITPEAEFSYVSFETNVPMECYDDLIMRVLDIFQPGKFLMTLFANSGSQAQHYQRSLHSKPTIRGYQRNDHQFCQLKNYGLSYSMYRRATHTIPTS